MLRKQQQRKILLSVTVMLKIEVKTFIGFLPTVLCKEHTQPNLVPPLWMDFIYTVMYAITVIIMCENTFKWHANSNKNSWTFIPLLL